MMRCGNIDCPWCLALGRKLYSFRGYSCYKWTISTQSWDSIRQTKIEGHSVKPLASILQKCQGCESQEKTEGISQTRLWIAESFVGSCIGSEAREKKDIRGENSWNFKKKFDSMVSRGFPCGTSGTSLPVQVWSLSWEDPLEEVMATHSSALAWRIPWTEEPGWLQSIGLQKSWTLLKWLSTAQDSMMSVLIFWFQTLYYC